MKTVYNLDMKLVSGRLFVDVEFWCRESERFRNGTFIFDTGASVTTISNDVLIDLGYELSHGKPNKITTASGMEEVMEINVDKIRLDTCVLENISVYAHNFPVECFTAGVIGMNIISLFDVNLLFSKYCIELTKLS